MSDDLDPAGLAEYLAGRVKWIAVAVFAAVITVGALGFTPVHPNPLVAAAGAVAAFGAATLLVLRGRPA
jgi:hypothetical protein